jgi:hypothetical protein
MSDSFEQATGASWEVVEGEGEGDGDVEAAEQQAQGGGIPHAAFAAVGLNMFEEGGGQTSGLDMDAIIVAIKEQHDRAILRSNGKHVLAGKTLAMALGPTGMSLLAAFLGVAPNRYRLPHFTQTCLFFIYIRSWQVYDAELADGLQD